MKFKSLGAMVLALAFTLMGMSAASAQGNTAAQRHLPHDPYYICEETTSPGTNLCIYDAPHQAIYAATNDPNFAKASISFIYGYTTPNGNVWWFLKTQSGLCLNWLPTNGYVYADSCIAGDHNELWYNHVAGQLINLAGNEKNGHNTYLRPVSCGTDQFGYFACFLYADTTFYNGWTETAT